ncbi:MAG: hypothetical protein OER97_00820 [Gammaproteobacteria bacterium]|nr:hypothetical protein [Gammaproteobacteria bacterium]
MTKERTPTDADGVTDPLVTETYAEIATELTPASINEALLRQASAQAGGTYSRSLLWLRPMAWAATIGLCLAIVVELSNVPQPEAVDFEQRSLLPESRAGADQQEETHFRDDKSSAESDGRPSGATSDTHKFMGPASTEPARDYQPASQVDGRLKSVQRREQDAAPAAASPTVPARNGDSRESAAGEIETTDFELREMITKERQIEADVDAFHVTDAPILDEAADMARLREGPNQEAESSTVESRKLESVAIAGQAINADGMGLAATSRCDAESRSEPESWLECIEELTDAGRAAEADEERQALADAFPDFDIP